MPLPDDLIEALTFVHPRDLFTRAKEGTLYPPGGGRFEIRNEVKPVDLFCYLGGRFGYPNGIHNFLRADDADNLIHWDWTLSYKSEALVRFLGLNFRTEIFVHGLTVTQDERVALVAQIKNSFAKYGAQMSVVRKSLEHWTEFVNPYQRVRRSIDRLLAELNSLDLATDAHEFEPLHVASNDESKAQWESSTERYSRAFGLCFGIRSMLPVAAEAFVNLLLYTLMRPEIRRDERLRENVVRQPIDVRIKSLSLNCVGFKEMPDYASPACRRYHALVNERNDLLHGNVVIDKLKFNDVYFHGKVPVFRSYRSWWDRSLGVELTAVGLNQLQDDISTVDALVAYLMSCVHDELREKLDLIMNRHELGLNTATQSVGVLFPPWLIDFYALPNDPDTKSDSEGAA